MRLRLFGERSELFLDACSQLSGGCIDFGAQLCRRERPVPRLSAHLPLLRLENILLDADTAREDILTVMQEFVWPQGNRVVCMQNFPDSPDNGRLSGFNDELDRERGPILLEY